MSDTEEQTSELRRFLRPVGAFEPASSGTIGEMAAALIVGDADTLAELVDRMLGNAVERLEDDGMHQAFAYDRFATKEGWMAASSRRIRSLQDVYFARELLRRCFAEGVLEEKL